MTRGHDDATLERWFSEQQRRVDTLKSAIEGVLAAAVSGRSEALEQAVATLATACDPARQRDGARRPPLRPLSSGDTRAGARLRQAQAALRRSSEEAMRLSRRLTFVVTQMLRVNGEILAALASATDPGTYDPSGAAADPAAAPGPVRAEA